MPGPVRYDKKGKVKKAKPKVITGSGSRPLTKAEQKSPRVTTYSPPTPSPKPSKGPRARRSPLATPPVQSAVERLRRRYTDTGRTAEESRRQTEGNVRQREARVDQIAASQVKPDPSMSRTDFIGKQNEARQNTALSSDGKTVKKFRGKGIVGTPATGSVARAAKQGQLRGKKKLTTPEVRQTKRQVRKARRQVQKARAAVQTPRKNLMAAGLDPEQARILTTVLKTGRKMGASQKEMLAAVQTALVESNISNPTVATDHDSLGWRQERQMYYDNPTNVKASSRRFFQETAEAGRGAGMTPGQLAQSVQRSAFPEKYDQRTGEAQPLLQAFSSAGNASPKAKRRLDRAKNRLERASGRAAKLGLGGAAESEDRYKGPLPDNATVWPVAIRGTMGGGPEDHAMRAFGDWQSDNAVDINIPVGTPVRAIRDGVITRTSGSPPNHSGNPAGWNVYLKDKNGVEYFYAHLEEYSVKPGDKVKAGDVIAKSGAANGVPHLHFATPYEVDPRDALKGATTKEGGSDKPKFVNYSKKGGVGTSQTKWLTPTGGNEFMKFQRPLAEAMIQLAKASGEPIQVNSAFRTRAEQEALYQAYLDGTGNLAAKPGTSQHEFGAAVDVNLTPKQRELAPQFGLGFPVAGEDWHMELVGDAANQIVSTGGGGGGSYPTSGGGTSTTSGGVATGPAGRKRRQATILDRLQRPEIANQLRKMGFQVTPQGVFRVGGDDLSKTEFDKIKARFGIK